MVLKIFKGVWFISVLAVVANLMYVYASLPEDVLLFEEGLETYSIGREPLFYACMGMIGIVNLFVFLFSKSYFPAEDFRSWLHGLIIALNAFFIASMSFIAVFNSAEGFDYSAGGMVIYILLGLVGIWTVSWPFYIVFKKYFSKPSV